jgi:CO/xanthine dehydrogenase Mo-binding subunit
VDGKLKVAGAAPHPSDVSYPGMAYAAFVRSTIAAGRVLDIDAADALALPGVHEIVTHRNAPNSAARPRARAARNRPPPLHDDRVLHHGQYRLQRARHGAVRPLLGEVRRGARGIRSLPITIDRSCRSHPAITRGG